jgi:hypothetical protein
MSNAQPEAELREDFINLTRRLTGFVCDRIENSVLSGTPDLTYTTLEGVTGFIELKVTPLKQNEILSVGDIHHWTGLQREFMRLRKNSKTMFMLLRMGPHDILLTTEIMFLFEKMPIYQILEKYAYIFPNNKRKFWTDVRLNALEEVFNGRSSHLTKKEFKRNVK